MAHSSAQISNRIKPLQLILPIAVLGFCLFYAYALGFLKSHPGINYDYSFKIILIPACADVSPCKWNPDGIQVSDQIIAIGGQDVNQVGGFPFSNLFNKFQPGDRVAITIERKSEKLDTTWIMPDDSLNDKLKSSTISLLIALPFWLIGSVVYLFMEPHDDRWFQFFLFCYLVSMWLTVGATPATQEGFFTLELTRFFSWILVPSIAHLHLVAPNSILKRKWPVGLVLVYLVSYLVAIASFFNPTIGDTRYLLGMIIAFLFSMAILFYRSYFNRNIQDRQSSRIMLLGLLMAPGLTLALWAIPSLFNASPGQNITNLIFLALPMLPVSYFYAIYKQKLGERETGLNRLIGNYVGFLVFFTIILISFVAAQEQLDNQRELLMLASVISTALLFTLLPFRSWMANIINRLTYGTNYRREQLISHFATRIPAATNRESLVTLIQFEILPVLQIEESVLFTYDDTPIQIIHQQGLEIDHTLFSEPILAEMAGHSSVFVIPPEDGGRPIIDDCPWLRLIIPLTVRERTIGYWLFGKRKPDNFYNRDDINLISTFAAQIAVTLQNRRLYLTVQNELAEKKQTEINLAQLTERLSFVHAIEHAILDASSPEKIAKLMLDNLQSLVSYDVASISIIDTESQQQEILAVNTNLGCGNGGQITDTTFLNKLSDSFFSGRSRYVEDIRSADPAFETIQSFGVNDIRSLINIPLITNNQLIGSLFVASTIPNGLTKEILSVLEEVSSSVSVAIYNARLRETIDQHSKQLIQLSKKLIQTQENERKNISFELHDEIGQLLTAITFNLADMERNVGTQNSVELREKITDTRELTDELMTRIRDLSLELRPAMLHDLGLLPTLRWYIKNYSERFHLDVSIETTMAAERLPEDIETTAFRVVQEALTNVSKHANAGHVLLTLERQDHCLHLSIKDDGLGFDTGTIKRPNIKEDGSGIGLVAMRERVGSVFGTFDIRSTMGAGTELLIDIPLPESS